MKTSDIVGIILIILAVTFVISLSPSSKDKSQPPKSSSQKLTEATPSYTPSIYGAEQIPSSIYKNTLGNDTFYDIINPNNEKKHIFWAYADCPIGRKLKSDIDSILEINGLNNYYIHDGNLMSGEMIVKCNNQSMECVEPYLYDNCSDNICIINPPKKELIKVPNNDTATLEKKLLQMKNW